MSPRISFANVVETLTRIGPPPPIQGSGRSKKASPKKLTKQEPFHYQATESWAWESLAKFPKRPPIESLHFLPDLSFSGIEKLDDGPAFVEWANFGNAVGTWNARDPEGVWACEPGSWIIAMADLSRGEDEEFGDACEVAFGCWRLDEGFAVAIVNNRHARDRLVPLMGIEWPSTFRTASLWYGE